VGAGLAKHIPSCVLELRSGPAAAEAAGQQDRALEQGIEDGP
jgi:hypothetical protein